MLGVPVGAAVTGSETVLRPVPPVRPRNTQVTGHRGRQRAESRERSRDLPRACAGGGWGLLPFVLPPNNAGALREAARIPQTPTCPACRTRP